jgi:MYXO-CTERM domain-containing protein
MGTVSLRRLRSHTLLPLLLAAVFASGDARAEADVFGVGDGHSGDRTAAAANEVINSYAPITGDVAAGATQIAFGTVIGDGGAFAAGDLVLIWRATGVDAADANVASGVQTVPGTNDKVKLGELEGGAVGRWELARVSTVTGSTMTLTKPVVRAWKRRITQVVKVPEFANVTIPGGTSFAAEAWRAVGSGYAGGIVAFLATGTVTVNGTITASERGFRGGPGVTRLANAPVNCPNNDGTVEQGYAPKGESIVATKSAGDDYAQVFGNDVGGRGNRSIGAGGGNCIENGGGGGGNFGQGGVGGRSVVNTDRGGKGGAALDYSLLERFTLGGGGGAGEQKNGLGSGGGIGGGVVFFRADALAGGGTIQANGEAAENAELVNLQSDGAGGGGAGGSVLIRVVRTATCGALEVKGGKGGDSHVVGLSAFGPGGGGAGGRALLQAETGAACPVAADPGAPGQSGGIPRGAAAGEAGEGEPLPAPGGNYCYSNPATDPQCTGARPVCNTETGFCLGCTGPFSGGSPRACPGAVEPVCMNDGSCLPCNGDFGGGTTQECQLTGSPYCFLDGANQGSCGKCSTNADCVGPGHPGPNCNPTFGACGTACLVDAECKGTEWCSDGVCVPKTPNGQPVPNVPPIGGECTEESGARVCIAGVCEPGDDLCGLDNGSPCGGVDDRCRSEICFPGDDLCGKPTGEPCAEDLECRSELCEEGVCKGCSDDRDCPDDRICDTTQPGGQCVPGCRPGAVASDAGGERGLCPPGQECVSPDGGAIGECQPTADGGADGGTGDGGFVDDTAGIVEGGGCACRSTVPSSSSPLALAGAALGALLLARRRRNQRRKSETQ